MAVLVQQSTTEALEKLRWYSKIQLEQSVGCVCTEHDYRGTREAVLLQQEHSGVCAGPAEYYRSTREAMLVQQSTTGALVRLCSYSRLL